MYATHEHMRPAARSLLGQNGPAELDVVPDLALVLINAIIDDADVETVALLGYVANQKLMLVVFYLQVDIFAHVRFIGGH